MVRDPFLSGSSAMPLLLACTLAVGSSGVAKAATVPARVGVGHAAAARRVLLDQLLPARRTKFPRVHVVPRPRNGLPDAMYYRRKVRGGTLRFAVSPTARMPAPSRRSETTPPSTGFDALNESCGYTPSDMGLAVSPHAVLQVVNGCIAAYNKNGALLKGYPKSLVAFLGLSSSAFVFDPRALYDWVNHRFVVTLGEQDSSSPTGSVWIAVSASSNVTGKWYLYHLSIPETGQQIDYPTLGQDREAVYVGFNVFQSNGPYSNDTLFMLPKGQMYAGTGFSYYYLADLTATDGVLVDSTQPANTTKPDDNPRGEFMVSSFNINSPGGSCFSSCNGLVVWAVSNPLVVSGSPGPEVSDVIVGTADNYAFPPGAQQPGTSDLIDTGDTRVSGMVAYSAGSLYASLNTKNAVGQASVLWFQLQPYLNDGNPRCSGQFQYLCADITGASITNEQCFACGGIGVNGSTYYGTLEPDPEGNAIMTYGFSDDNNYAELVYTARRVTGPINAMHDIGYVQWGGSAPYLQGRWGDYTGTALDISNLDFPKMWFSGMYVRSDGSWGTAIGSSGFTAPNQP